MCHADARRLWLVQLRLEGKGLDAAGQRMVRVEGPDPHDVPTCSVARFHDGFAVTFSAEADDSQVDRMRRVRPELFFADPAATARYVARGGRVRLLRCSTYVFPPAAAPGDPSVVRKGDEEFAVFVDGREVAWASSVRANHEAAELYVYTDPECRRRGYGQRAACAWAAGITGQGRVAFYSHLEENEPSRRLAARLGAIHLFDLVNLTLERPRPW